MAKKAITASHNLKVNSPSTKAGMGCLLLFALPFAAVGVAMLAMVASELWTWRAAQLWIETSATLLAEICPSLCSSRCASEVSQLIGHRESP